MNNSKPDQKVDDAVFLRESFGMSEGDAANLVTESEPEADKIADAARKRERDPLADKPIPESGSDFVGDSDEHMLKPVVHRKNNYRGAS